MLKIQYVSDLHIEFRGNKFKNLFKVSGDILCLAGDICVCGNPEDFELFINFLKHICPLYSHVIHITGNHEYYAAGVNKIGKNNTIQAVDRMLKKLEKVFDNYHFLNCRTLTLLYGKKKYIFCGATLWTDISKGDKDEVEQRMNDYNHIYYEKGKKIVQFNVTKMKQIHKKHKNFIKRVVKEYKGLPNHVVILITHHKPVADTKNPDILTQAYESDITEIILPPIKLAIHGHTHTHYNKIINKVRYVSNPKGYIGQHTKFVGNLVIKI